jgi:hypothetical protein
LAIGDIALTKPLKRQIKLLPLVGLIFFNVAGGPYGIEPLLSTSWPGMALLTSRRIISEADGNRRGSGGSRRTKKR